MTESQPFAGRYEVVDDCYIWSGAKFAGTGYGAVRHQGRARGAHRVAYELAYGPIAAGLVIDHLCRNRACIRVEHLEAVPQQVNVSRGMSPTVVVVRRGYCKRGHTFSDAYLAHRSNGTVTKRCRTCHNDSERRRRQERDSR